MNRLWIGGRNMNDKQIEMMKKLIEEKKQKGNNTKNNKRPKKVIGRMLLDNGKTTQ
jgi:hypothetical protein